MVDAEGAVCDYDNPKGELQVRVALGKSVNYRDSTGSRKVIEQAKKRKASQDEMTRLEEDMRSNLHQVLGSERLWA